MKAQFKILFPLTFLLYACGNSDPVPPKFTPTSQDTLCQKVFYYFNDPKADITDFGPEIDHLPLKAVFDDISNKTDIQSVTKTGLCAGDNCTSYKILFDTTSKTKLYLIKSDFGEYGSANNQFLFRNDSIVLFRNYQVALVLNTDTSKVYTLSLSETIYEFNSSHVKIRKRSKAQTSLRAYTLNDLNFTDSLSNKSATEKFCREELQSLLDIEKIAD